MHSVKSYFLQKIMRNHKNGLSVQHDGDDDDLSVALGGCLKCLSSSMFSFVLKHINFSGFAFLGTEHKQYTYIFYFMLVIHYYRRMKIKSSEKCIAYEATVRKRKNG